MLLPFVHQLNSLSINPKKYPSIQNLPSFLSVYNITLIPPSLVYSYLGLDNFKYFGNCNITSSIFFSTYIARLRLLYLNIILVHRRFVFNFKLKGCLLPMLNTFLYLKLSFNLFFLPLLGV